MANPYQSQWKPVPHASFYEEYRLGPVHNLQGGCINGLVLKGLLLPGLAQLDDIKQDLFNRFNSMVENGTWKIDDDFRGTESREKKKAILERTKAKYGPRFGWNRIADHHKTWVDLALAKLFSLQTIKLRSLKRSLKRKAVSSLLERKEPRTARFTHPTSSQAGASFSDKKRVVPEGSSSIPARNPFKTNPPTQATSSQAGSSSQTGSSISDSKTVVLEVQSLSKIDPSNKVTKAALPVSQVAHASRSQPQAPNSQVAPGPIVHKQTSAASKVLAGLPQSKATASPPNKRAAASQTVSRTALPPTKSGVYASNIPATVKTLSQAASQTTQEIASSRRAATVTEAERADAAFRRSMPQNPSGVKSINKSVSSAPLPTIQPTNCIDLSEEDESPIHPLGQPGLGPAVIPSSKVPMTADLQMYTVSSSTMLGFQAPMVPTNIFQEMTLVVLHGVIKLEEHSTNEEPWEDILIEYLANTCERKNLSCLTPTDFSIARLKTKLSDLTQAPFGFDESLHNLICVSGDRHRIVRWEAQFRTILQEAANRGERRIVFKIQKKV